MAEALIYAAEKAPRDLVVGGADKGMLLGQRLSPRLMDAAIDPMGYRWQQMDGQKPEDAPDYLYEPIEEDQRTEGSLGPVVVPAGRRAYHARRDGRRDQGDDGEQDQRDYGQTHG